ncbi:3-hydroxyacyl-CoA dehydrogenase [Anaplasma capra]|uniref:3-hydroxyacyl-CoA dehydrogenase n=1 Tax=Anaplasma capra TaxID=1562740 RepID=UPI0021D574C9|nr:3-hydroxyacyl-CoA dehydrogenase [Anaplasma capra]
MEGPLQIKKLAIIDPTLSNIGVINNLVSLGVESVLFCDDVAEASKRLGKRVELRDFNPKDCDLSRVDWVVELIDGGVEEKAKFYNAIFLRKSGCVLSSSVRPALWDELSTKIPEQLINELTVIHFPTFFRGESVLEFVFGIKGFGDQIRAIQEICKGRLEVFAHSCRGGLFDRVGYFWVIACLSAACECGVGVEVADYLIANKRTGIPPPGPLSVLDALGVDNFVTALDDLIQLLGRDDPLCAMRAKLPWIVSAMISDGLTGFSGCRGGFYRAYDMRNGKVEQVIDLTSGLYRNAETLTSLPQDIHAKDKHNRFLQLVWEQFFSYVEHLIGLYGEGVLGAIDDVLQTSYKWQYSARELASRVNVKFDWQK